MTRKMPLLLLLLALTACGSKSSPLAPESTTLLTPPSDRPLSLAISGQSNSAKLRPYLEAKASVVGYSQVTTLSPCWDNVPVVDNDYAGVCWVNLKPLLHTPHLDAFVWWHGDADSGLPGYGARLSSFLARVRQEAQNPSLLIVIPELGPVNGDAEDGPGAEAKRWTETDPHSLFIPTRDIGFDYDRQHMTPDQYQAVAERIVNEVKRKVR